MFGRLQTKVAKGVCSSCGLHGDVEVVTLDGNVEGSVCVDIETCEEAKAYSVWNNYTFKE